jgi:hypothetical protein
VGGAVDDAEPRGAAVAARDGEAAEPAEHQERADAGGGDVDDARRLRAEREVEQAGGEDGGDGDLVEHDALDSGDRLRGAHDGEEGERRRERGDQAVGERELPGDEQRGGDEGRGAVAGETEDGVRAGPADLRRGAAGDGELGHVAQL